MAHYFQSLFFILSAGIFAGLVLKNRNPIFFFRGIGLVISGMVVFTYNINWLMSRPVSMNLAAIVFLVLAGIVYLYRDKKVEAEKGGNVSDNMKKWGALFCITAIFFAVGFFHFERKLDTPNYKVGDAAIHYMLMSQTANTGMVPFFLPNELYKASGSNVDFERHNANYFPGTSVGFFVLSKLVDVGNRTAILQIFNIILFAFVSIYFVYIFRQKNLLKNNWIFIASIILIGSGTFFDFVYNSYTTQIFGLFLLLVFVDTFDQYLEEKVSFFVPMVSLAALIVSYFYWLPVALLFVAFAHSDGIKNMFISKLSQSWKNNRKMIFSAIIVFGAGLLSVGYIISLVKQNMLGYASANGGIPKWKLFFPQASLIFPLAVVYFYSNIKHKMRDWRRSFVIDFALAIFGYSLALYGLFVLGKVSGYSMLKSLYLTIPTIWILGMLLIDQLVLNFSNQNIISILREFFSVKNRKEAVLLLIIICGGLYFQGVRFIPLTRSNLSLILKKKEANITAEQMLLLDKIKKDFPSVLQDNRITVVAPFETALWIYAYNGIWPRTYSLLAEGETNYSMGSAMGPSSAGIIDYPRWLQNDENHYLVLFDTSSSQEWIESNRFQLGDYDVIASNGNNYLLKLKDRIAVELSHKRNNPSLKNGEKAALPYEEDYVSSVGNLAGLAFKFDVSQKKLNPSDVYVFSFSDNSCASNGKNIFNADFSADSVGKLTEKDYLEISFDRILADSKDKKYCVRWFQQDGDGSSMRIIQSHENREAVLKEIYTYQN